MVELVEVTVEIAVLSELDSVVWFSFVRVTRSVPCRSLSLLFILRNFLGFFCMFAFLCVFL